jgi:flagellar basal-body rod modification protein FlgD
MKLLVTQLQHQDPLDPMDSREMVTQLAELSSVEELVAISGRIGALEVGIASIANTQVASIVGQTVTADGGNITLGDRGGASAVVTTEGRADSLEIKIRDAEGTIVRTITDSNVIPGSHAFEWDGNNEAGDRLPAGRYSVEVSARGPSGDVVVAHTRYSGRATGVSYENGYPELLVGDARILLGDVVSIEE